MDRSLATGKGRYAWTYVSDIYDFKRIISLLRSGDYKKAARFVYNMDTSAQEEIPRGILRELEKEF